MTVDGRSFELAVLADQDGRVELEIAREPVKLAGWPARCEGPPGPVEVNGESWPVTLEVGPAAGGVSSPREGLASTDVVSALPATAPSGGVAVVPPMPGRVVEVRVKEGERVEKGAVLLVLEAMKMRNEVPSPSAGLVRQLKVREGTNVRAREAMMLIAPE